jgi:DeoR/GlpR family transcriptional regulator of sugar metabolism
MHLGRCTRGGQLDIADVYVALALVIAFHNLRHGFLAKEFCAGESDFGARGAAGRTSAGEGGRTAKCDAAEEGASPCSRFGPRSAAGFRHGTSDSLVAVYCRVVRQYDQNAANTSMNAHIPAHDYGTVLPASRRSALVQFVVERGQATVLELAGRFQVSPDTIRRDLDHLSRRGLLSRTHGGAVVAEPLVGADAPFASRLDVNHAAKLRIARAAVRLIASGETLIVNGGSTTLAFACELGPVGGLTVVTNNLSLPAALPPGAVRDVYLLGGQVRTESQVTLGPVAFAGTGTIHADTAVIGVGGVSPAGLSTTLLAEASMMAAMIAASRRVIVLADASKFDHNAFAHIVPLGPSQTLVSNQPPPPELAQALGDAGVDVIIA